MTEGSPMKFGLDPGHGIGNRHPGVNDPGAKLGGYWEANLAAGLVERLRADLAALGHEVIVTGGELTSRDDAAKAAGVSFFLSVHFNGGTGTGVECFVDDKATARARGFAAAVTERLSGIMHIRDRGVKTAAFAVLRANANDALLEVCFPADVDKYQANVDAVELGILNALLKANALPEVTHPPRLPQFLEARIHLAAEDKEYYMGAAAVKNDYIRFASSTKDAWKQW